MAPVSPTMSAQIDANSPSPPNAPAAQLIRDKYQSIQVETFEVKLGVEFPPEYLAKAQEEMFKQLPDGKIVKEVRRSADPRRDVGANYVFVGNDKKRYAWKRSKRTWVLAWGRQKWTRKFSC